jgi:hypothetical protein
VIISIKGIQDCGKTATMVACIREHLLCDGYKPEEVFVNFKLNISGVNCLTNANMKQFIRDMINHGYTHRIIGITEADRIFPARFWSNKEQTETLLGLWQDEKLFNIIYYDAHIGTSVDLVLRQTRQMSLIPKYNKRLNRIRVLFINGLFQKEYYKVIENVSEKVFPYYNRWEVIK